MAGTLQGASLRGTITANGNLSGTAHILSGYANAYTGEYVVTPSMDEQTMPTKNRTMTDDVTVEAIPFYEVANSQGNTFIIGG